MVKDNLEMLIKSGFVLNKERDIHIEEYMRGHDVIIYDRQRDIVMIQYTFKGDIPNEQ